MSIICSFLPLPSCVVCRILFVLFSLERLLCCLPRAQRKRSNKMLMAMHFFSICNVLEFLFFLFTIAFTGSFMSVKFFQYKMDTLLLFTFLEKCPIVKLFTWLGLCRIRHWQECHETLCDSMTVPILLYLSSLNKFLNKVDVCLLSDSCLLHYILG